MKKSKKIELTPAELETSIQGYTAWYFKILKPLEIIVELSKDQQKAIVEFPIDREIKNDSVFKILDKRKRFVENREFIVSSEILVENFMDQVEFV